jgi:ubiquinone/menaquinone biosynthesis C-methylase UbiE
MLKYRIWNGENVKTEIYQGLDDLYMNRNPFVRNLFWQRIKTALTFADIKDDSVIVDIGCGTGTLLKSIREVNGKCVCWGTDVLASTFKETADYKFQVADARNLPFEDGCFDIVFVLDTLEHIKDNVESAIREIKRILKPDGYVILGGPTESIFYRFCRLLLVRLNKKRNQEILERQEIEYHYHNVYQLERGFNECGFSLLQHKSLPGFPLPPLFRIYKFHIG